MCLVNHKFGAHFFILREIILLNVWGCELKVPKRFHLVPPSPQTWHKGNIAQVSSTDTYQGHTQCHMFPNDHGMYSNDFCEIFHSYGHSPWLCPILKKYSNVPNSIFCEFCVSPMHNTNQWKSLDAMADWLHHMEFRVNEATHRRGCGGYRGGRTSRRGILRCYNYDQEGHVVQDFPLLRRYCFSHFWVNSHVTEDFPKFIYRWEELNR